MVIGTRVRHRLGRWEVPAARLYRGIFVDLPVLADRVAHRVGADAPAPTRRILEVGCGDGAFGTEITRAFAHGEYLGIDIAPTAGRTFRGDASRASFRVISAPDLLAEAPEPFDLVCLVDVLHHVAPHARAQLLACAAALTAPHGHLAVKDHDRAFTPSYALAYAADRFVTGDRDVSFLSRAQLCRLVAALPGFGPLLIAGVPPLRNNVLCLRQRHQPAPPGGASPDPVTPEDAAAPEDTVAPVDPAAPEDPAPPDRGSGPSR